MRRTGRRADSLLASPVFAGSIALLLVNDHVLKAAWPGLVTGKLSDVAGVVMVAMLLTAIVARPAPAFGLTAVAFGLLKTWPPVAVWAAPVLGGITRTDPTDLIALAVLVPLWRTVRRPPDERADATRRRLPVRIVLVGAAIFATTATGDSSDDLASWRTGSFAATTTDVYVWVDEGEIMGSSDGGLTWRRIRTRSLPHSDDLIDVSTEACRDEVCWSVGADRLLRSELGASPVSVPLPDGAAGSTTQSRLVSVTVDDGTSVVAWLDPDGIVRIGPDEQITWHPVAEFDRSAGVDWAVVIPVAGLFAGPLAVLASAPTARRSARRRGLRPGGVFGVVVFAGLGLLVFSLFVVFLAAPLLGLELLPVAAIIVGLVALPVVAWSWSRWRDWDPSVAPPLPVGPWSTGSGLPPPDGEERVG